MSRVGQDFRPFAGRAYTTEEWAVCASALVRCSGASCMASDIARRAAPALAAVTCAAGRYRGRGRLDAPWRRYGLLSFWQVDGAIIDVPDPAESQSSHRRSRDRDRWTSIWPTAWAVSCTGPGRPTELRHRPQRRTTCSCQSVLDHVDPYPLLVAGWGNLIFVVAPAALAGALYSATGGAGDHALLINAAALFGSTLAHEAGLPALALATGGPQCVAVQPEHHWLVHDRLGRSARLRPGTDAQ